MKQEKRKTVRHFNDPGHAHFLTFSCYKNYPLLKKEQSCLWFLESLEQARKQHSFQVLAFVLMPDHVHLLVLPINREYDISMFLKSLKQSVSRKAKEFLERNDPVWLARLTVLQGRKMFRFWEAGSGYDRNIHSREELMEKMNYIHNNPVRKGFVFLPDEWKWSSAAQYNGKQKIAFHVDCITTP